MSEMFICGCSLELVAKFFRLADHLQLQATGTFARTVCLEEAVWSDITAREFHGFRLSPVLLKPPGWRTLARFFRELQQVHITIDSSPYVHFDEATVQKLIGMLRSANQSMNRSKAFVGVMRFPRGSLPSSLDGGRRAQNTHTLAAPTSGIGDVFSLRLDLMDIPSGVARCSVSEDSAELTLHFGWQSNHLHMALRDDGSLPGSLGLEAWGEFRNTTLMGRQGGRKIITLDIAACSSAMTMHHRGVCVIVNGPWTMCNMGLFVMRAERAVVIDALAMGVPCVVCARHAQASDMKPMTFVSALNLGTVGL